MTSNKKMAVLVPCHNEALTIAAVTRAFRQVLPEGRVYVYDNNSTDLTKEKAAGAGAVVRSEPLQGKGNVVRRMFADIDADLYVLVDGDNTYDVSAARRMVDLLVNENLDMVVGARTDTADAAAYRHGHQFGNAFLSACIALLFGKRFTDVLSGYRIFSRRFVKSFPALASGFEIETELTVHALELRMPVAEVGTRYSARPEGSTSKLNTYRDGLRILMTIVLLLKEVRPFAFFGTMAAALALESMALGYPLLVTYLETGLVPRFPTAILATGVMLLASLSLTCGMILDSVSRGRRELKRMAYLAVAPFQGEAVESETAEAGNRATR